MAYIKKLTPIFDDFDNDYVAGMIHEFGITPELLLPFQIDLGIIFAVMF